MAVTIEGNKAIEKAADYVIYIPEPQLSKEEHTMIKITPDFPCIHCGACAKACSHGVIKMVPNEEGKLIPRVSFSSCRYCRACRWACPVIPREEV